eukprot:CAMPEP_0175092814 /NCGR_PEP_ID=MMETSP0086_2-20121207/2664_1 /TAXON_ID=136419 /ORGANISM="Unknown Unknown, Strain D1" /LENGTH=156 /DNA_ID=CAMNT_0016365703 /DNA_START=130 /DNA_END=600 /DNA_ORIENTATION=-
MGSLNQPQQTYNLGQLQPQTYGFQQQQFPAPPYPVMQQPPVQPVQLPPQFLNQLSQPPAQQPVAAASPHLPDAAVLAKETSEYQGFVGQLGSHVHQQLEAVDLERKSVSVSSVDLERKKLRAKLRKLKKTANSLRLKLSKYRERYPEIRELDNEEM